MDKHQDAYEQDSSVLGRVLITAELVGAVEKYLENHSVEEVSERFGITPYVVSFIQKRKLIDELIQDSRVQRIREITPISARVAVAKQILDDWYPKIKKYFEIDSSVNGRLDHRARAMISVLNHVDASARAPHLVLTLRLIQCGVSERLLRILESVYFSANSPHDAYDIIRGCVHTLCYRYIISELKRIKSRSDQR